MVIPARPSETASTGVSEAEKAAITDAPASTAANTAGQTRSLRRDSKSGMVT